MSTKVTQDGLCFREDGGEGNEELQVTYFMHLPYLFNDK